MKSAVKSIVVQILTALAATLIRKHKPIIIAVTGSVGKTSTKDAIYAAIRQSVPTRKSEKSFNSEIGVPLTVLGLPNGWNNPFLWIKNIVDAVFTVLFSKQYPKVLVLETGIDRPGDMTRLTSWIRPDIVVLTRLPSVPVHVEYFSSPQEVIAEKMRLVEALKPDGVLVYNNDDTIIEQQLPLVRHRMVGYSRYLAAEFNTSGDQIIYTDNKLAGTQFTVTHRDERYTIKLPGVVGTQSVYACGAALAVAAELSVPLSSAAQGLQELTPPRGRMRLVPGIKGTMIIDDTYNSSPIAVEAALQTLREVKYVKRKIAVLGDMLELGKYSSGEHERIGTLIPGSADFLITIGIRARKIAESALAHGLKESNILQYDDVDRAGRELQALLQPGDVILVKASQGIRAERIVEEVMAEPELASSLLVRQERAWKR